MKKKILIVDDNEGIRYTLQEICLFANWEPILAENGEEGIQQFLRYKPDVILIDFHMPQLDGLTTVKTLRQMDQTTPIIVLTVDERQEVAEEFIDAGANDFALKPIKAPDIIARINVHLQIKELLSTSANGQITEAEVEIQAPVPVPGYVEHDQIKYKKGISKSTFEIIANYLYTCEEAESIEKISEETGISYPTVHRYLQHMVEENMVIVEAKYGSVGRPKNKYKWR